MEKQHHSHASRDSAIPPRPEERGFPRSLMNKPDTDVRLETLVKSRMEKMKTKHSRKKQKLRNPVASFMNEVNRAATYVDRKKAMKTKGVGRRGQWLDMIELAVA